MTSIDLTPREKICCCTYFLTPKLNFSACSKKTSRKAVFWTILPGLEVGSNDLSDYQCCEWSGIKKRQ